MAKYPFNSLREIRLSEGLTLLGLAEKVGTTPTQIARLEKGERQLTAKWLEAIAKALHVHPQDILKTNLDSRVTQLVAMPEDLRSNRTERPINPNFLIVLFNIANDISKRNPEFTAFTPKMQLLAALTYNGVYIDLFNKIGLTTELMGAIERSMINWYFAQVEKKTGRLPDGSEGSLDDKYPFFQLPKWGFDQNQPD